MSVSVRSVLVEGPKPPQPRGPYTYASTPRGLYNNAKLWKDPPCESQPRVAPGAAFAGHKAGRSAAAGDGGGGGAAAARRRALARRKAAARLRPGTPPPAPGRKHYPIQTEYYLEELFEKCVEMEVGVQTDLFADRPATPPYVPAKTGADAATQIWPGELFDFDLEVQPILETLVGGTASAALAEAAREEELAALREAQARYRELRDAERAERDRLARQDARLCAEKERRVAQARAAAAAASETRLAAAAATLVQGYVERLVPETLAALRDQGHVLSRSLAGVEEEFMPWLTEEVTRELESIITSRDLLTELVREVVESRAELYAAAGVARDRAREMPEPESDSSLSEEDEEEEEEVEVPV